MQNCKERTKLNFLSRQECLNFAKHPEIQNTELSTILNTTKRLGYHNHLIAQWLGEYAVSETKPLARNPQTLRDVYDKQDLYQFLGKPENPFPVAFDVCLSCEKLLLTWLHHHCIDKVFVEPETYYITRLGKGA